MDKEKYVVQAVFLKGEVLKALKKARMHKIVKVLCKVYKSLEG